MTPLNYLDFMPLARNRWAFLGNLSGTPFAQWACGKNFTDTWRTYDAATRELGPMQDEIYGVDNIGGEQWLTLTMLGPHRLETLRAVVTKVGEAPREIQCTAGHPYALINFVPHDITVWGLVGGMRFYWKARYRVATYTNPFLREERLCIEQSEEWGNPANHELTAPWQWVRGGPVRGGRQEPFIGNTIAGDFQSESAWFQGIGFNHGPGFVMGSIKDGARVIESCASNLAVGWEIAVLKIITFKGEIPLLPGHLLPDSHAQYAMNCDFQHGELRGVRGARSISTVPTYNGELIVSTWTEDGSSFFGWPWETDVVKSQVVGDIFYRIFYTGLPADGPVIKVARTFRNDSGVLTPVINSPIVGGNYRPPEASNVGFGGNNLGPDSWMLGVPEPKVQNVATTDKLEVVLDDKREWPGAPSLKLRVTFFVENPAGEIVFQVDISNTEAAKLGGTGTEFPQVAYTNDSSLRGNKIQDMLWPLLNESVPAPYKFYWCEPPAIDTVALSRQVVITNTTTGNYVIPYNSFTTAPPDPVYTEQA